MAHKLCIDCKEFLPESEFPSKKLPGTYAFGERCSFHYMVKHLEYRCKKYKNFEPKDFLNLMFMQKDSCAVCDKPFSWQDPSKIHIDHCHTTGNVRGLLCHGCNIGIGMLKESEDNFLRAIEYLKNK